jgi:hypothetical protein
MIEKSVVRVPNVAGCFLCRRRVTWNVEDIDSSRQVVIESKGMYAE